MAPSALPMAASIRAESVVPAGAAVPPAVLAKTLRAGIVPNVVAKLPAVVTTAPVRAGNWVAASVPVVPNDVALLPAAVVIAP